MKLAWILSCSLGLAAVGCGDDVTPAETSGPGSSASSSVSASSTSSSTAGPGGAGGESVGPGGAGGEGGAGTAGAGGLGGSAGAGGGDPASCDGIEDLVPSDPVATDAGGDGTWSPGESATLTVTLTNSGSQIFSYYPGIAITSDHPEVTSAMPTDNHLFGLAPGDSDPQKVIFDAAASVPSGTTVHFTATVNELNQTCSKGKSIGFDVTIE